MARLSLLWTIPWILPLLRTLCTWVVWGHYDMWDVSSEHYMWIYRNNEYCIGSWAFKVSQHESISVQRTLTNNQVLHLKINVPLPWCWTVVSWTVNWTDWSKTIWGIKKFILLKMAEIGNIYELWIYIWIYTDSNMSERNENWMAILVSRNKHIE